MTYEEYMNNTGQYGQNKMLVKSDIYKPIDLSKIDIYSGSTNQNQYQNFGQSASNSNNVQNQYQNFGQSASNLNNVQNKLNQTTKTTPNINIQQNRYSPPIFMPGGTRPSFTYEYWRDWDNFLTKTLNETGKYDAYLAASYFRDSIYNNYILPVLQRMQKYRDMFPKDKWGNPIIPENSQDLPPGVSREEIIDAWSSPRLKKPLGAYNGAIQFMKEIDLKNRGIIF